MNLTEVHQEGAKPSRCGQCSINLIDANALKLSERSDRCVPVEPKNQRAQAVFRWFLGRS